MTLLAGGCSFVWGSELADHKHGGRLGHSNSTFAALLAKGSYTCAAYPGIGNKDIADRILEYYRHGDIVLICWSWPTRDGTIDSDDVIIQMQKWLEYRQAKYMFTCADNCIITGNPKVNYSKWFLFPPGVGSAKTETPRGFYQWAVEEEYQCGPESHPLEQAHFDAANLMQFQFLQLTGQTA